MLRANFPNKLQQKFAREYEYSGTKFAIIVSMGVSGALAVLSIALLVCFGKLNKRCKTMRMTFLALAFLYLLCIIQTLVTGVYWVKYVDLLNEVMQSPANSQTDMYDQVEIETVQVTGGLASIRISTQLTFYNCGFYGLAMLLSVIAAHILKNASCHTHGSISYTTEYNRNIYSDDQLTSNGLLLGRTSHDNSTDNGMSTPDQIVTPQRSIRSYDGHLLQSRSESTIRHPHRYYSHNTVHGGTNTYISYKDVDSIDKLERLSQPLTVTTLDRNTFRSTQV